MKDFSMYRYYKGENENPFDTQSQNSQSIFWLYEEGFEKDFLEKESSDWFAFFASYGLGDAFMKILSEAAYEKPTPEEKKQIFELWLDYLFSFKLYPEYGGENMYKKAYYKIY